ncbi:D-alanyl-glycyl endopeptidase-like protein [Trypanosoma theileri]|uniref:D-alanyl-glycyl endopeptidase-like protein n=1 Tax=Trypanosoma theileri TaxID=67003 RepID=A0A1X0NR98_9TRYP|nr:D-alanyl-glycyl endopeptidase-like protein [Trypanosoma theileri]ORC87235.1 D-alanyl-glycyl endopeptidase-like protein [Trypanosoma theileri]
MQRDTELWAVPRKDVREETPFPEEEEVNVTIPNGEDLKTEANEEPVDSLEKRVDRATSVLAVIIGWTLCVLVVLFLGFIVFGILYSGIHYHGDKWHEDSDGQEKCSTPFGAIIGVHNDVFAYSNCDEDYISKDYNTLAYTALSNTGLKWQCVEYARRYWMLRGSPVPATFSSVEGAADIWELQSVQLVNGAKTPLLKYSNGLSISAGGSAPRVGDLLIYPRQKGGFVYGHVAVIVDVLSAAVLVAEQNWDNTVWPGPFHNYSRSIPMQYDANSKAYTLKESDDIIIQGWMRYSK